MPQWALKPVLPSAKELKDDVVHANQQGQPILDKKYFLIDCELSEDILEERSPELNTYLQIGRENGSKDRYLARHRTPWYSQEKRPPAPLLCTYMGRTRKDGSSPLRFILNYSEAIALNVYLMMYPKEPLAALLRADENSKIIIWNYLKAITPERLAAEGRIYGGGLRKIEPAELGRVGAQGILEALNLAAEDDAAE